MVRWRSRAGLRPTLPCPGPGGECSVRTSAPRSAGSVEPPRPHAAWPRGGGSTTKISRREVRRLVLVGGGGSGEGGWIRAEWDGADTHLCYVPLARIISLPSWTCAGTCRGSSAWPHSAPCRPARSPRPLPVAAHSSASSQHLLLRCPLAFPRGPVPDARLPSGYRDGPQRPELCIGEGGIK